MNRLVRALARDERGASVIELALALPILSVMLVGMVELSQGYAARLKLEQAAQSSIEGVQQKGYAPSTTSLSDLEDEAEARAGTGAVATASHYLECTNGTTVTKKILTDTCASGYTTARYVAVSIAQSYTPMFAKKFAGANADGSYSLTGKAALRFQ